MGPCAVQRAQDVFKSCCLRETNTGNKAQGRLFLLQVSTVSNKEGFVALTGKFDVALLCLQKITEVLLQRFADYKDSINDIIWVILVIALII